MNNSIFNIPPKEVAKKLVIASNKKIKHTEALEIVYKMNGYDSYINDGQKYTNTTREIEQILNKKIEEELIQLWKEVQNYIKNTNNSSLSPTYSYSKEIDSYFLNLFWLLEKFFLFDDNTFLDLDYDIYGINIKKRLLDLAISPIGDGYSEEIIEDFIERNLIQNIPFDGSLLKDKAIKMNPKKFINWFKKCFKLKYNFFSESYYFNKIEKPINSNIKIEKSDIIYLSNESASNKSSNNNWILLIECNYFLVEIDYLIPHQNIKVRLSYCFCIEDLEQLIEEIVFNDIDRENIPLDLFEYIKQGLISPYESYETTNILFKGTLVNNAFAHSLVGIQFSAIDGYFEDSLLDYFKEENFKNTFLEYLAEINMYAETSYPDGIISELENKPFITNFLKEKDLNRFETIKSSILNLDIDDEEYGSESEVMFNHRKDLVYSLYKYMFASIDESLPFIMNRNTKDIMIDVFKKIIINTDK